MLVSLRRKIKSISTDGGEELVANRFVLFCCIQMKWAYLCLRLFGAIRWYMLFSPTNKHTNIQGNCCANIINYCLVLLMLV